MADLGFWNFARREPNRLALVDPDGREWTRGELLAGCNQAVHGPARARPEARATASRRCCRTARR